MQILVINIKTWGDMVLSLPFLQHLREQHPDAEITLLTGRKGATVLHAVGLPIEVRSWRTLTVAELRRLKRADLAYAISPGLFASALAFALGARHRVGFHQAVDAKWDGEFFKQRRLVPRWRALLSSILLHRAVIRDLDDRHESLRDFQLLPPAEQPTSETLLRGLAPAAPSTHGGRTAAFFPFSSAEIKDWPIRRWHQLAQRLLDEGVVDRIHVLGESGHEGELSAAFCGMDGVEVLAGKLCIESVFRHVQEADLVVANDSLGLHLASLYDRPAVGLFGPNPPKWYGAISHAARNLYAPLACSPCIQPAGRERCLRNHGTCPALRRIPVDQVVDASRDVLR